jgi:hypothetical protein
MVEVRFASGDLSGRCGTKRQRVAAYGAQTAHALGIRLAQLAVVASMADFDVIPCLSAPDGDGHLLVEVDADLSLLVRPVNPTSKRLEALVITATVFKGKHQW